MALKLNREVNLMELGIRKPTHKYMAIGDSEDPSE